MVKLRDGQRCSSICHSASVSSWASSTTMWANGPASRSRSVRERCFVDERVADAALLELRHQPLLVVELEDLVDDAVHLGALGGDGGLVTAPASGGLGITQALPGRVQQRQVGDGPVPGVARWSMRTSSGVSQGAHIRR